MKKRSPSKDKSLLTQQSLNRAVKAICDVLRRSNCAGAMQYVPELTWMLFLRVLDEQENIEAEEVNSNGKSFASTIQSPYRWKDWGASSGVSSHNNAVGWKRQELEVLGGEALLKFINQELFPYLKNIGERPEATLRQKIVSEIASNIGATRIDTEYNLLDVLDRVDQINVSKIGRQHMFPLSQIYEYLLLHMGHKSGDGGQFFTPREVIRAMVKVVDPKHYETVYDPCCGTGGFLAQSCEYIRAKQIQNGVILSEENKGWFYGREKENLVYPLALANLILHGVNNLHIWHGNTLTGTEYYGDFFKTAPSQFDVILTNPPFGGKENKQAQINFYYKSSSTQLLFLQHVIDNLKPQGRCGIVIDEGVLFRTNDVFVQIKQKLLNECDLWCIVSLPAGAFINAGASIKTNILFFNKGKATEKIWYYDLSDIKVSKKVPLTLEHFSEFFELLPHLGRSDKSWLVTRTEIEEKGYDLKAVNPHLTSPQEGKSLDELLKLLETQNQLIQRNLHTLGLPSPKQVPPQHLS